MLWVIISKYTNSVQHPFPVHFRPLTLVFYLYCQTVSTLHWIILMPTINCLLSTLPVPCEKQTATHCLFYSSAFVWLSDWAIERLFERLKHWKASIIVDVIKTPCPHKISYIFYCKQIDTFITLAYDKGFPHSSPFRNGVRNNKCLLSQGANLCT